MLTLKEAAQKYAAIGSEPRLAVLQLLVKAGDEGMTISEIGKELDMPASTLAHHMRYLVSAGVVVQEKQGREVWNTAHFDSLGELGDYLLKECCANSKGKTDTA